jgi:LysM repeat protein
MGLVAPRMARHNAMTGAEMVSNQSVTQHLKLVRGVVAGLVLVLSAGCQLLTRPSKAEAEPEAVATVATPKPRSEENAIETALANDTGAPTQVVTPAPRPGPVLNANAPDSYTVRRGDTLWDISAMYLRDPWLWPEIWHVNNQVANPHLIYPGDVLKLAYGANGEPQIHLIPGNAVRVSPLVRSTVLDGPIAVIPFDAMASFLGRPTVLSVEELRKAPRVAAMRDDHLIAGLGQDIYVKGFDKDHGPGMYSVIRVGQELKDPESGKVLGFLATYASSARIDDVQKVSRGTLVEIARETVAGDVLFSQDLVTRSDDIIPHAPPAGLKGQIIAVVDGVSLIGQYQVVALNRGSSDGLETGHVLAIDTKGELVTDRSCTGSTAFCTGKQIQLPNERAGTMLVFKTYSNMSYALIVETTYPIRVADHVRTP